MKGLLVFRRNCGEKFENAFLPFFMVNSVSLSFDSVFKDLELPQLFPLSQPQELLNFAVKCETSRARDHIFNTGKGRKS